MVALTGTAAMPSTRSRPRRTASRFPTTSMMRRRLRILIQGLTAWHLYRTAGRVADGRERGRALRGRGRRLAGRPARPTPRRGAGDRGRLEREQARAGAGAWRRRRDRLRARGPHRAFDRGQRGAARWTSSSTWPEGRRSSAPTGRSRTSGGSSSAGSPRKQPNEMRTGSLLRHSRSVVGFYLFHCLERPAMVADALDRAVRAAARGELRVVVGGAHTPWRTPPQAHVDLRERRTTGKLLLDPTAVSAPRGRCGATWWCAGEA